MKGGKKQYQEAFKKHLSFVKSRPHVRRYNKKIMHRNDEHIRKIRNEYDYDTEFYMNLLLAKGRNKMKVKILIDDPLGLRWDKNEIGEAEEVDDEIYHYFVILKPQAAEITCSFFKKGDMIARNYFFTENEVEILNDE